MKKLYTLLFACISFFAVHAQLSGTKNIPGDYANLGAAITALNTSGVGSGGVILNVIAGNTQTATGTNYQVTATGTAANPITIQGNGNTVNYTGTAGTLDGVFVFSGSDYVTLDNFVITGDAATEWGVALLAPATTNGAQHNVIKNLNITLNKTNTGSVGIYTAHHTPVIATVLTVTSFTGTNSYNRFYNNVIQNVYNGYSITGFPAAAPYDLYDQQNEIGNTGLTSSISNYGGGASQAQGVFAISQNKFKVYKTNINSAGGTNSTGVLYGINLSTGLNSDVDVYSDTLSLTSAAAASNMFGLNCTMGGTGAGNTVNVYNNLVQNCSYTLLSSGEFRGLYAGATATYTNVYNNTVTNNTLNTSGQISPVYYGGSSSTLCLKADLYNNTITSNNRTAGVTLGQFNCLYASSSTVLTQAHDNIMNNNGNATASAGATYGYYNFAFTFTENTYNNQISNLTGGTGVTVALFASSGSGPTNKSVYNNQIYAISGAGQTGAIQSDYATTGAVYKNNIYNISSSAVTGTPGTFGINIGANIPNTDISVYNNFISELKTPASTATGAIYGLWLQGSSVSYIKAFNNTVYLDASSSSSSTFGTAAAFIAATPADVNMRNNILVNMSTPGPTGGFSAAVVKGSTAVINYDILSSYNCLYAGTPAANRLIYNDGTNSDQTLAAFINRVNPRDHASFSELPPFINVAVSPYNLHINPASATQCESGGTPIALVATDYDGNARFNNAGYPVGTFVPKASDVGADEFGGNIMNDIAAPRIDYTALGNDVLGTSRTQSSFATITDPSGVNTTAGTKPRLYYKKSTNANTFNDNTNATDGWKYVEASNSTSPFSFTIDYTALLGGTVSAGDIIQYFVISQDLAGTPNVSMNAGGFTLNPATVNLAAANFPIAGTINQYTISGTSFAGTINVGSAETITSLTNAGGLFQQINSGVVTGDVTVVLTSDLAAETGTYPLMQWSEKGAGNYRLSITPDGTTIRTISGTSATAALLRLDSADRVTIDGRFAGAGNYLRIRNLSNVVPGILIYNDAQNNIIRNCIIESGNTTGLVQNTGGAIQIGNSNVVNGSGNDNNMITYNEIRDRSDIAANPILGIVALGATTGPFALYNDNNVISNNNIHDFFSASSTVQTGIHIGTGNSRFNVDSNSIYQTAARVYTTSAIVTRGINISSASSVDNYGGYNIRYNYIGGTAPGGGANGNYWTVSSSGAITNIFVPISSTTGLIPTVIAHNVIKNIDYTTVAPAAATSMFLAISTSQGIYDLNNNQIGAATGNDSLKITINASTGTNSSSFLAGILAGNAAASGNSITNNFIGSITVGGSNTVGQIIPQWIEVQGTPAQPAITTGNLIGSTTTANSIRINSTAPVIMFSYRAVTTSGAAISFSNNTIQNITDNSSAAGTTDYGVLVITSVGGSVSPVITNNTFKELAGNSGPAAPALVNVPISVQNFVGTAINISGNTISGIRAINSGATNPYPVGIYVFGNTSGGIISKNKLYDFTNTATGATAGIYGIYTASGSDWTASNNMIAFNNGANLNNLSVNCLVDGSTGGSYKSFYNSIYLGGNGAGAQNSYGFIRFSNAATSFRNNLIVADRNSGAGFCYAISNQNTTPTDGWPAGASSYNTFITPTAANVGEWMVGATPTGYTFAGWKTVSGGDLESYADINANVSVTNLYNNAGNGDLTINPANQASWYVNNKGIAGSATGSIASDLTGDTRGTTVGTPTDIGADEFTPNAGVLPPDAVVSAAPANSTTTSYTFGGRKLGDITWSATGTVPTSISWKYYSGISPLGGAINSYHDVPAVGGSGYTYDIKQYYTLAEQNQITDANLTGIKKTGAAPWAGIGGTPGSDASGKYVTSTNLIGFSLFSLAPVGVVPVRLVSFTGVRSSGINHLFWKTENEINTRQFILERSSDSRNFTGIATVAARGYGNAEYGYNDMEKLTGKNYYRLKIMDINGRFIYSDIVMLSDNKSDGINIYPNPVHDIATLQVADASLLNSTASLLDANGRKLATVYISSNTVRMDMSKYAPGTYLLQLSDKTVLKIIRN